tara:strand:+ start:427 stop:684 length:258 start_codon:yes stop_codon:yes gene_type:complete
MFNNKGESKMNKRQEQDVWLVIKRTFWSHDNDNWFDVSEQANSKEKAEIKKTALETLNDESKVSYLIVQSRRIEKVKEDTDEIPF